MDVRIGVLGPLLVERAGQPVRLDRAAWRRVLLVLVVHHGELVDDARLVDACWGDAPPSSATRTLRTHVSHLRRRLGSEVVARAGPGYRLALDPEALDAARFEALLRQGRSHLRTDDPAAAVAVLESALSLWRGPALADVADEPFARLEAARLEELRLVAAEELVAARLEAGVERDLVADARALATAQPERERGWELLLRALGAAGRPTEAHAVYREVRDRLVEELGTEPGPALRQEHRRLLLLGDDEPEGEPPGVAADPAATGVAVPRPTDRFVGREALLDLVGRRLADHRLVTLLGPGGSGKTRLALEASARRDGPSWFVDLAAVTGAGQVAEAVRSAVGAPARPGLGDLEAARLALAGRPHLLVLDNCEHLVDAAADVAARLLGATPELRVLATSRTPLDVAGEQRLPVPPLALPDEDDGAPGSSEAVELFVERAADVDPSAAPGPEDLPIVARICRQLDGMPLAIELAAARTAHLSLPELAARLEDRFGLLVRRRGDERHRTLRAAVDWSYRLLEQEQQVLFRRLGVFVGSFTLEAASGVHGEDAIEELTGLVDHSMVVAEPATSAPRRYRLLETLRVYADELLDASDERDRVRDRHLDVVVRWAAGVAPGWSWLTPDAIVALGQERGNLRAAVGWAVARGRHDLVVQVATDLVHACWASGWIGEPRAWLEAALATAPAIDEELRLRSLLAAAWFAGSQSDYPRAREAATAAEQLAARRADELARAQALDVRANAAWNTGDWDLALELYDRLLPLYRAAGELEEVGVTLQGIAAVAYRRGAYRRAAEVLRQAEEVHREAGLDAPDWWRYDTGILANRLGDHARAEADLTASLQAARAVGETIGVGASLRDLALLAANEDRPDDAVELATASLRLHRESGDRWGEAATLQVLARAHLLRGASADAERCAEESLRGFERLADDWGAAGAGIVLARAASAPAGARAHLDVAQRRARRVGDPWLVAESLDALAERDAATDAVTAATAAAEADATRELIGAPLPPSEHRAHQRRHERLRDTLGPEAYAAALEEGRRRAVRTVGRRPSA
jgi:predicted ATPase/DNA-binding SARP family transcriptional activator